jgi:hypothetical protein
MRKIIVLLLSANILFAVPCNELIRYIGSGGDSLQYQEIILNCTDGYKFRVFSEINTNRILEIEDNKYLKKGDTNENKEN